MNTSLFFINLSDEEICQILEVVSVPYLMEPIKKQPEKYLAGKKNTQSLSRETVNHIYLKFLREQDPVLSLYLSDIVVDIIHYFKLSDSFKSLLTDDHLENVQELKKKIKQRQCPITVDMFLRLLDRQIEKTQIKEAEEVSEPKFFDIEQQKTLKEEPLEKEVVEVEPPVAFDEKPLENEVIEIEPTTQEEAVDNLEQDHEEERLEDVIRDLQYQIMNLQMENQTLKDENRDLLFQTEDENELEDLQRENNHLKEEVAKAQKDFQELSMNHVQLQNELRDLEDYKNKHNQALLELRDYKIKYISLQAEVDRLRYMMKNDSKKLKELQKKQRSVYDNEADWMMAMHDLTWYKKQWNLPGNAPLHKIWAHLNREEAKGLAHLLKNFDRLLRTERKKEIDALKEILIVKEAILILLRSDKAMKESQEH